MPTTTFTDQLVEVMDSLDTERIPDLFAEDVEVVEIDQTTPPSAPAKLRGRDSLIALVEDLRRRGLEHKVERVVQDGDTVVLRSTCRYPDGKLVAGMAMLDVSDGKVVRYEEIQAWDA